MKLLLLLSVLHIGSKSFTENVILADIATGLLRSQGVAVLDFFCASRRLAGTMSRWGFLPGEHEAVEQFPILFQPVDRRRSGITFLAYLRNFPDAANNFDWYVTKGDGDQDRPN